MSQYDCDCVIVSVYVGVSVRRNVSVRVSVIMNACVSGGMSTNEHESMSVSVIHTLQCSSRVLPWEAALEVH